MPTEENPCSEIIIPGYGSYFIERPLGVSSEQARRANNGLRRIHEEQELRRRLNDYIEETLAPLNEAIRKQKTPNVNKVEIIE